MDQIQKDTESTKKEHLSTIGKLKETHDLEIVKLSAKLSSMTEDLQTNTDKLKKLEKQKEQALNDLISEKKVSTQKLS